MILRAEIIGDIGCEGEHGSRSLDRLCVSYEMDSF